MPHLVIKVASVDDLPARISRLHAKVLSDESEVQIELEGTFTISTDRNKPARTLGVVKRTHSAV